jgi:hypothetical protein
VGRVPFGLFVGIDPVARHTSRQVALAAAKFGAALDSPVGSTSRS